MDRRQTTTLKIGDVAIGGQHPVSIQSMTNTDTRNKQATLAQIKALAQAGCQIVRVAVLDTEAVEALQDICAQSSIPVVADIHFDHRLALKALENGVKGLRINPGNIGAKEKVAEVVARAKYAQIPIRIGVNAGSLEKDLLERYHHPTAEAMVESALRHIDILEKMDFRDIKISLKSSDVSMMIKAYRLIAAQVPYPLHLGVTEAGNAKHGIIKSAIGIGTLLAEGIGDTIRVSLTGDPLQEIPVAKQILQSLNLRQDSVELISCPTCGRCQIDLASLVDEVDKLTCHLQKPLKIAIMGCVVNGPGEAKEADLGIAGGKGQGLLFKKGKIIATVPEEHLLAAFKTELEKIGRE